MLGTMPPAAALAGLPSIGETSAPDGSGGETTTMVLSDLLTAGGPGGMVPAAGAYVGDGMPPVPAKLAAKVRRWEFVEMGELLPEFWVGQPRELERGHKRADETGQAGHGHLYLGPVFWDVCGSSSPSRASRSTGTDGIYGHDCSSVTGLQWVGLGPIRLSVQTPSSPFGEQEVVGHKRHTIHNELFWEVGRHSAMRALLCHVA